MRCPSETHLLLTRVLHLVVLSSLLFAGSRSMAQTAPAAKPDAPPGVTVHADNGLELKGEFNGKGPYDVLFDTGSSNIMSASLAKDLGLNPEGAATIDAGGGDIAGKMVRVETVKVGGLVMSDQWFTVIPNPGFASEDFAVVGDQLLQNLAVKLDFERQQLTFYDGKSFVYSGDGVAVPARVDNGALEADGSVDGMPARIGIDTGDMWSLMLMAPFVSSNDLIKRYGATIHGYAHEGWGGADAGYYTRAGTLTLGSLTVSHPVTTLLTDSQGAGASTRLDANIGLHILKQFTIVFDCPHGKIYLEKNSSYGKPDIFNRAGLVLDPDPDNLAVKFVFPGSPGAAEGLVEGDVITQIDGAAPTDETLNSAFAQPVGTVVKVTVRHGGQARTIALTLKEVL
jgi:Aspartyl protease